MNSSLDSGADVSATDLTDTESRAYQIIQDAGRYHQSELWKALDVSSRTGTRVARSLAEKGLITRTETAHNGSKTYELRPERASEEAATPASPTEQSVGESSTIDALSEPEQAVLGAVKRDGELPVRSLIREFDSGQETIEDAIDALLERELVEIERQRLYGRESVLISIAN